MKFHLLLPLVLVSCGPISPDTTSGMETYRYVNTLDFGNDNSLDQVTVIGRDESGQREATSLTVTVGNSSIILRDPYDGTAGGAMYNPSVALGRDGALVVSWGQIGQVSRSSEIVTGTDQSLVERKRTTKEL